MLRNEVGRGPLRRRYYKGLPISNQGVLYRIASVVSRALVNVRVQRFLYGVPCTGNFSGFRFSYVQLCRPVGGLSRD